MGARQWTEEQKKARSEAYKAKQREKEAEAAKQVIAQAAPVIQTLKSPVDTTNTFNAAKVGPRTAPKTVVDFSTNPPVNLFNGRQQKLQVIALPGFDENDPIPGYQLYWFDDREGGQYIQAAKASHWEFVEKHEIANGEDFMGDQNSDLGNYVRRPAGGGLSAYLMKQRNDIYEWNHEGPESIEVKVHQQQEAQLRAGTLNESASEHRHVPGRPAVGFKDFLPAIRMDRSRR